MNAVTLGYAAVGALVGVGVVSFLFVVLGTVLGWKPGEVGWGRTAAIIGGALVTLVAFWFLGLVASPLVPL